VPIYVYEVLCPDDEQGQLFEVVQKMSDPPLTRHPTTGQPVRRVIQAPNLPRTWTDRQGRKMLSAANLARHGLTRYEKSGTGTYVKTAGQGPDHIAST
jgi:hypothetical protein